MSVNSAKGRSIALSTGQLLVCCVLLTGLWSRSPTQAQATRRVNAPHFAGDVPSSEMAVFWFGRVGPTENYADVRVGYNDQLLRVRVTALDRRLWYDTSPHAADLADWDAVTLYLDTDLDGGSAPRVDDYRFVGQLNWWEERDDYQAVYRGDGSSWMSAIVPFSTVSGWRGDALNNGADDRGWVMDFLVPFASLGLAVPDPGETWGLAVSLHDRDDAAGTPIPDQVWPESMQSLRPAS